MSLKIQKKYFILFVMSLVTICSFAQTVKQLETQRKKTLKLLETTNAMLKETKKSQRTSINKLVIIKRNIHARQSIINNYSLEVNRLDNEMSRLNNEKQSLNKQLTKYKNDYATLVQKEQLHRNTYDKILFVLSAKDFNQSFRRFRYLQEYSDYRKQQVNKIKDLEEEIDSKTDSLNNNKVKKQGVIDQKEAEKVKLKKDQRKENSLYFGLKKQESSLRRKLRIQQKKANELNNKIEHLIAEEIRKAEAKRKADLAKGKATSKTIAHEAMLTKEENLISGNFAANKGRLPWPTATGYISGHFGIHEHPVLKHVTIDNKGIYIQTTAGSNARAVFEGVVTQRFPVPGNNFAVIVKHGEYRTVYANLTDIYVNIGDKVKAKQKIGRIYTDKDDDNKTQMYFQIWKGRTLLNPEKWIAK